MGLLGDVSADEMQEASRPREPFPEGDYAVLVAEAAPLKTGPSGAYIPLVLTATDEATGESRKVWMNMSLSSKARPITIKNLLALGVDPNMVDDPTQLQGCQGRAHLKLAPNNKGVLRNEVAYFIMPKAA